MDPNLGFNTLTPSCPPPIEPPPAYFPPSQPLSKEEQFRNIILKYEISQEYAGRLQQLRDCKIVFIFDDSGSMNSTLNDSPLNQMNQKKHVKSHALARATIFCLNQR